MDDRGQLEQHILLHRIHLRPILDVGAVAECHRRVGLSEAVVDAAAVDAVVELVGSMGVIVLDIGRGGYDSAVCRRSRYASGVHQGDQRKLSGPRLGAFSVGEIAGGVTDGKASVGGDVACSEAGAAERRLDDDARAEELLGDMVPGGCQIYRGRLRIGAHREVVVADGLSAKNGGGLAEIVVSSARASRYDALVGHYLATTDLARKVNVYFVAETLPGILLDGLQDTFGVLLQLVDADSV